MWHWLSGQTVGKEEWALRSWEAGILCYIVVKRLVNCPYNNLESRSSWWLAMDKCLLPFPVFLFKRIIVPILSLLLVCTLGNMVGDRSLIFFIPASLDHREPHLNLTERTVLSSETETLSWVKGLLWLGVHSHQEEMFSTCERSEKGIWLPKGETLGVFRTKLYFLFSSCKKLKEWPVTILNLGQ